MYRPETEDAIWNTIAAEDRAREAMRATATPELSQRFGQIHREYPFLDPGVKLSLAKGNLSDEQVLAVAKSAARVRPTIQQEKEKKKKGWFERNVTDKIKTATRYGFAGLNLPLDMVQGAAGQFFDDDPGVAGWFISTDLGSLIANDTEAGEGYFIGGRAKELQAERARRYRGTIDGSAFTIGRGLASTFLQPDTTAYRIMSGAFDAATAIAVPTVPGAGQVGKAARIAEEAGKGGPVVKAVAEASRMVGRGSKEIGLTRASADDIEAIRAKVLIGDSVDFGEANRFFKSGLGKRIVQRTAETNDFAETWSLWGKKLDPATTAELAVAKTEQEVMSVLLGEGKLGGAITSTAQLPGTKKAYLSLAQRNKLIASMPLGEGVSQAYAKMPRKNINLLQAETPRDQIEQLDTLERTMALFKANPEQRATFINRAGALLVSKDVNEINKFYDDLEVLVKVGMEDAGVNRNLIENLYSNFKTYKEEASQFSATDLGDADDFGVASKMLADKDNAGDLVNIGPQSAAEIATREFFVPDPRQVRRLTGQINWLWVKKDPNLDKLREAGQLRLPLAAVENFQEKIWRPMITATVGNFFRNIVDSQVSIALTGKAGAVSPFVHPVQYYKMVRNNRGIGDIFAQNFDEPILNSMVDDALRAERAATMDFLVAEYQDPVKLFRRAKKLGIFKDYTRTLDNVSVDVARAHGDELGRINADWATRTMANSDPNSADVIDEVIQMVKSGTNEEANIWYRTMQGHYKAGVPIYNKATRTTEMLSINLDEGDNLKYLLEGQADRLSKLTGNDPDLLRIVGQGKLNSIEVPSGHIIEGSVEVGQRVIVQDYEFRPVKSPRGDTVLEYPPGTPRDAQGNVLVGPDGTRPVPQPKMKAVPTERYEANVIGIADDGKVQIEPFAFNGIGDNSIQLEKLLKEDRIYKNPNMPARVVGEIRNPDTPEAASLLTSMNRMVRKFHAFLYDQPIAKLERSPYWRGLYYSWVDRLAVSLDETSINQIIDDITTKAAQNNMKPENYTTPELWAKLQDFKQNPDKLYGTLSRQEMNAFAAGSALDDYEKSVYNAVERRNGVDALRLISPFLQQQVEFFGRVARATVTPVAGGRLGYVPNPYTARKIQLMVEGGREADPDGDGRGFFFTDPTTGQWSFQFPLTGELTKLAFGIEAPITAPVKGVAMGLDVKPGLGPFATIAASKLLRDTPTFDFARSILIPYGERGFGLETFIPTWAQKINEGLTGAEGGRFFANTYVETMQALAATGQYNLDNPDEQERMMNDARTKAQMLTVLRGITQFTGPASGDFDFTVPTDQGDIHATGLAYALQNLRNDNYDTATLRFIEIFGEDAFVYLSNKTVSEVGGLEATDKFFDWQRNNESLFSQYGEIAGYFGPVGTEFDFEAYTRQLQTGQRRRLTASEVLESSQRAIGLAYYKDMRNKFGESIDKTEREYLRQYKEAIKAKYPGFANMQFDPQKTQRQIDQLFAAAQRSDLDGNSTAEALRYYEQVRGMALAEAQKRGLQTLQGDRAADLQQYLQSYADALIEKYPEFARVYNRVLVQEID
jgi:hypothetical protein